jgi:hypothetical protein
MLETHIKQCFRKKNDPQKLKQSPKHLEDKLVLNIIHAQCDLYVCMCILLDNITQSFYMANALKRGSFTRTQTLPLTENAAARIDDRVLMLRRTRPHVAMVAFPCALYLALKRYAISHRGGKEKAI